MYTKGNFKDYILGKSKMIPEPRFKMQEEIIGK